MLSDEEKQAIEELKNKKADYFMISNLTGKTLVNLIEKQSKEIEHQIEKRANQRQELAILNAKQIEFNKLKNTVNSYKGQFKRQQKEIEELKEYKHDAELTKVACCSAQNCEALNNCIKLERELQNTDKEWEDKIRAKTIEIKNRQVKDEFITASQGKLNTIIDMESLLEKE